MDNTIALFIRKFINKFFDKTLLRFMIVGVINTLVGCGIMFILYNLVHCSYYFSSAMNYLVGGIVSFFLNKYFTFKNNKFYISQVFKFAFNIAFCYLISYSLSKKIIYILGEGLDIVILDNIAMLLGMVLFTTSNYLIQKFFVFKDNNK